MFTDEAAILQAAATLAVAQYHQNVAAAGTGPRPTAYTDSCVDVLINVLRQMEQKALIPNGLAPTSR